MPKVLTTDLIFAKTKTNRIELIDKLNLWGNDLSDVSILPQLTNIVVLSLSVNQIDTLKDFRKLKTLKELYLRNNKISEMLELKYLSSLSNLRKLTLNENPVAEMTNYRLAIISVLPNLEVLDDKKIEQQEREAALKAENLFVQDYLEHPKSFQQRNVEPTVHFEREIKQKKRYDDKENQRQEEYFQPEEDYYENPVAKYMEKKERTPKLQSKKSFLVETSKVGQENRNIINAIDLLLSGLTVEDLEDVIYLAQRRKAEMEG